MATHKRDPQISATLLKLIAEIDEFKGAWRALGSLKPEVLERLRWVAGIESVGSSTRIEGSKLSNQEVERLLSNLSTTELKSRDEEEVVGYSELMNEIFDNHVHIRLTENYIKQLHQILLKYSQKDERHRGEYKKHPNNVEAYDTDGNVIGVIFETATPFDTPGQLRELVAWTGESLANESHHPLIIIAIFIVEFLAIHPFLDGNGRLSRALTILLLLRSGYDYVPYSSLESIIENSKDRYYLALRKTQQSIKDGKPDYTPWLLFFLRSLNNQKDHLLKKVKQEKQILGALPELSSVILKLARERGRVSTSEIERVTGEPRSTIKKRLSDLVKSRLLKRHGKGRSTWYGIS
jgi:Fic family protein